MAGAPAVTEVLMEEPARPETVRMKHDGSGHVHQMCSGVQEPVAEVSILSGRKGIAGSNPPRAPNRAAGIAMLFEVKNRASDGFLL